MLIKNETHIISRDLLKLPIINNKELARWQNVAEISLL